MRAQYISIWPINVPCENSLWLPEGCLYIGFDISTVGLAVARESNRPALLVRGDGEHLPLATASVDVVLSTWVVEHLHDPGATLMEAMREEEMTVQAVQDRFPEYGAAAENSVRSS